MPDNDETPSLATPLLRALRPGFRPRRWNFLVTAGVVIAALPFVIGFSWTGNALEVIAGLGLALVIAAPVSLLLLLVTWKAKRPERHVFQRVVLQVFLGALATVPLILIGAVTNEASIQASMRRGDVIVAALEEYGKTHWRYPRSIEALERGVGRSLPRPSIDDNFLYEGGWRSFTLSFHCPLPGWKVYDSRKGCWYDGQGVLPP